jgi:hypothetical protein
VRLKPLSGRGGFEGRLSLLRSVTGAALRRELAPEEEAGLRVALEAANEANPDREPTCRRSSIVEPVFGQMASAGGSARFARFAAAETEPPLPAAIALPFPFVAPVAPGSYPSPTANGSCSLRSPLPPASSAQALSVPS